MLANMGHMSESASSRWETTHTSKRLKSSEEDEPMTTNYSWCEPHRNPSGDRIRNHGDVAGHHPFHACTNQSSHQGQGYPDMIIGSYRIEELAGCMDTGPPLPVTSEALLRNKLQDPHMVGFEIEEDLFGEGVLVSCDLVAARADAMAVDAEMRSCNDVTEDFIRDRLSTKTHCETSSGNNIPVKNEEEEAKLGSTKSVGQNDHVDIKIHPRRPDLNPNTNHSRTASAHQANQHLSGQQRVSPVPEISHGRCPSSLQQLSLKAALVRLGSAVWRWRDQLDGEEGSKKRGVEEFRKSVPAHIRQLLQEAVLSDWRVWDTRSLRLLQLLLAPDCCVSVRVQQVRLFFRDAFLSLLPPLTRLTDLRIQDCDWTLSPAQESSLCVALSHMPLLRLLSLRHIATDSVLGVVARHCPNLMVLDLLCSSRVTCAGALQLPGGHVIRPPQHFSTPHRRWLLPHCCVRVLEWLGAAITHRSTGEFSLESNEGGFAQCQCKRFTADPQELMTDTSWLGLEAAPDGGPSNCLSTEVRHRSQEGNEKEKESAIPVLKKLLFLDLRGTSVSVETAQHIAFALPRTEVLYFSNSS